ncbi:cell division protein SepF [Palaeococcus sp. (in: euryarchaeotes)]|uniref:cell division protein SepF n=1 Tax=Palaeococcus sp. (in: euryarchaeotes) TaxID=2820298 RepID=UPI0025F8CC1A|nr:cell division protein SepF [Palaeococcus sp. (in: euryarchaeotes)]MCD6559866.1 cell division protein SepF [Palaeococcus sp. (in: euryarchaeotes)]
MGLFDKITKKEEPKRIKASGIKKEILPGKSEKMGVEVIPLEEDELAKQIVKPQIRYVRKIVVTSYSDLEEISSEIQAGNIIIADLTPLESKPEVLEKIAEQIVGMARVMEGSVVKISRCETRLLITPSDIKIAK